MIEPRVRLAFLGCGAATRMHARTLARLDDAVSCAFASRDPARAREACARFRGAAHFGSYAEALADPAVDVALVATPPRTHLELSLAAIARGKHVIVEKPAFTSTAELDVVADAARSAGVRVFVAENYFYKPLLFELRRRIERGDVGEVLFVHVNALKSQRSAGWRDDESVAGGGALFEGGVHWIDFLSNMGLTVSRVTGMRAGRADGLDRSMLVAIEYAEGAAGSLLYSWEVPSLLRGLRLSTIYGTRGSITFETNGLFVLSRGVRVGLSVPRLRDIAGYRAMFRDFFDALRTGREARLTLARARADLALVEQVYRSARGSRGAP